MLARELDYRSRFSGATAIDAAQVREATQRSGGGLQVWSSRGAKFFTSHGWEPKDVQGLLKTAAPFKRAPVELLSLLPEPKGNSGNYPWTGVCLLNKR